MSAPVVHGPKMDPRFSATQDQAKHCYAYQVSYFNCIDKHGKDSDDCAKFLALRNNMCPENWYERSDSLKDENKWYGQSAKKASKAAH